MLKLLTSCFMFFFVFTITAQKNLEEDAIKEVIATFFKGLHTGDSAVVSKTFHKDIKIQTTTTQKGKKVLVTDTKRNLLKSIADKLNVLGIKTHRGKSFSSGSIHSILKRKKERDKWIEEVRNKEFPIKIINFDLS